MIWQILDRVFGLWVIIAIIALVLSWILWSRRKRKRYRTVGPRWGACAIEDLKGAVENYNVSEIAREALKQLAVEEPDEFSQSESNLNAPNPHEAAVRQLEAAGRAIFVSEGTKLEHLDDEFVGQEWRAVKLRMLSDPAATFWMYETHLTEDK